MSELTTLQQLERETGLLAMRPTVEEMKRTAYEFTVKAAQRLRGAGWRLLRADPPKQNVNGVRYQHLVNDMTGAVVDIIVNADDPNGPRRRAQWDPAGIVDPADAVDPPAELPAPPAPDPPPIDPAPDDSADAVVAVVGLLAAVLSEIAGVLRQVGEELATTNATLTNISAELQKNGIPLRVKF